MTAVPVVIGMRAPSATVLDAAAPASQGLVDTHGRVHRDLRISLTCRCGSVRSSRTGRTYGWVCDE